MPLWFSCVFLVPGVLGVKICSPLSTLAASLFPTDSPAGLFIFRLNLCPSYPIQHGLFSTFSCGESALPLSHFLGYLPQCGCYLVVSVSPGPLIPPFSLQVNLQSVILILTSYFKVSQ